MRGNGSTFRDQEDYWDMAELVVPTLCAHTMREINEHVALTDPVLNDYAVSVTKNLLDYVIAVAVLKPKLFTEALAETSVGCYAGA